MKIHLTPARRKAIYGLVGALNAIAVTFGLITGEQAAAIATGVTSIGACILAFVHVTDQA